MRSMIKHKAVWLFQVRDASSSPRTALRHPVLYAPGTTRKVFRVLSLTKLDHGAAALRRGPCATSSASKPPRSPQGSALPPPPDVQGQRRETAGSRRREPTPRASVPEAKGLVAQPFPRSAPTFPIMQHGGPERTPLNCRKIKIKLKRKGALQFANSGRSSVILALWALPAGADRGAPGGARSFGSVPGATKKRSSAPPILPSSK